MRRKKLAGSGNSNEIVSTEEVLLSWTGSRCYSCLRRNWYTIWLQTLRSENPEKMVILKIFVMCCFTVFAAKSTSSLFSRNFWGISCNTQLFPAFLVVYLDALGAWAAAVDVWEVCKPYEKYPSDKEFEWVQHNYRSSGCIVGGDLIIMRRD